MDLATMSLVRNFGLTIPEAQAQIDAQVAAGRAELMESGLRRHGIPILHQMRRESLLVDNGYLDSDLLAAETARAERAESVPSELCDAIGLEVGLRSLYNSRQRTP